MKKIIILLPILAITLITILIVKNCCINNKENKSLDKTYNIAIITPTTHPSLEQIEKGFRKQLPSNYNCKTFNGNSKKSLMIAQIKEATSGNYDSIFTIGGYTTQMACTIANQKNNPIPIVAGAPVELPKNSNITGVLDVYYPKKQVKALTYFKPGVKNVLVVYSPSQKPDVEKDTADLITELKNKNLDVKELQIFSINEIPAKVGSFANQVDTIIVIRDSLVVSGIDAIIKICNRNGITLVASDLDSGDKGAVIATGIFEDVYGSEAAKLTRKILEENIPAKQLPAIKPNQHHIKINLKSLKAQNLKITPYTLTLMKEGLVVGDQNV